MTFKNIRWKVYNLKVWTFLRSKALKSKSLIILFKVAVSDGYHAAKAIEI